MYNSQFKILTFKSPLPFKVTEEQIIYVEDEFNQELNQFIEKNYKIISRLFTRHGYDFTYIPFIQNNVQKEGESYIRYKYPTTPSDLINHPKNITSQNIYDNLFSFLVDEKEPLKPGFLQFRCQEKIVKIFRKKNVYSFSYFNIRFTSENDLWTQINSYFKIIDEIDYYLFQSSEVSEKRIFYHSEVCEDEEEFSDSEVRKFNKPIFTPIPKLDLKIQSEKYSINKFDYSKVYSSNLNEADFNFPEEAFQVIDEIKTKMSYLTQLGINEWVLKQLFTLNTNQKLSKLIITKEFRIFLPDYDNREIYLTPLPKAVFLLYLKHPKGILFKHLSDYKNELMNIYLNLSKRESFDSMEKSIDDLVDSTKNAINEKCSRIREAFIKEIDEPLAENYFITGERFSAKRIKLDRDLVYWETVV